jgi:hypothetical protein
LSPPKKIPILSSYDLDRIASRPDEIYGINSDDIFFKGKHQKRLKPRVCFDIEWLIKWNFADYMNLALFKSDTDERGLHG